MVILPYYRFFNPSGLEDIGQNVKYVSFAFLQICKKKLVKMLGDKKTRQMAFGWFKVGVSQQKIANSLKIDQSTVCCTIKKIGLKYRKRSRAPKATEAQKVRQAERHCH